MRILLTGGAGFIGTRLAERLVDEHDVVILDNLHRDALRFSPVQDRVKLIEGDVLRPFDIEVAARGVDVIVHLAAIAGVVTTQAHPALTMRTNMLGTVNVLEQALRLDLDRFIDFSTSEVYGDVAEGVTEETHTVQGPLTEPRWTYAVAKLAGEHLARAYYEEHGLPAVSVRPFNIYGPGQVGEGAIQNFVAAACAGDDLVVYGDGDAVRAWCHVDDMVDALMLILHAPAAIGKALNIGNEAEPVTALELATRIARIADSDSDIVLRDIGYPDVHVRIPDTSLARELLDWHPRVSLDDGIASTIDWHKSRSFDRLLS